MKYFIAIYLMIVCSISLGAMDFYNKTNAEKSLYLAIERKIIIKLTEDKDQNMGKWGVQNYYVKAYVIAIPLDREIIECTVNVISERKNWSLQIKEKNLKLSMNKYIYGTESRFLIYVFIDGYNDMYHMNYNINSNIKFNDIWNSVCLLSESGKKYPLKYTNLSGKFSPGMNKGYLAFGNVRSEKVDSYEIQVTNFMVNSNIMEKAHTAMVWDWSFKFDNTYIGFLDLVNEGIDTNKLREEYTEFSLNNSSLSITDVVGFISDMIGIISALIY